MAESESVLRVARAAVIRAPAAHVAGLVTEVSLWPLLFGGTLHAQVLSGSPAGDRLRLWGVDGNAARDAVLAAERGTAAAKAAVRTWTAVRTFGTDPARTLTFRQEEPAAPLTAMGGSWEFHELPGGDRCRVVLSHEAGVRRGELARHDWIAPMVDRITCEQLAALKAAAEPPGGIAHRLAAFSGSVGVPGPDRFDERVADPDQWPPLPHLVHALRVPAGAGALVVAEPGRAGARLTVCLPLPGGRLVTKRLDPPPALLALTGEWQVAAEDGGARVRLRRQALLAPRRAGARVRGALAADLYQQLRQTAALVPALAPAGDAAA